MKKLNFIRTSDYETKEKLLQEHFQMIEDGGTYWIFLNDPNKKMNFEDNKTTIYTNILYA